MSSALLYRAYHLNAQGGISRVEIVRAASDEDALVQLRALPNEHGIELWDKARPVGRARPRTAANPVAQGAA